MALVALVVLAAAPAGGATSAASRCHTGALSLRIKSDGAGLGHRFYTIVLRNESGRACSLFGYPGVSMLGRHKHQRGPSAKRLRSSTPKRFTLHPGQAGRAKWDVVVPPCNGGDPPLSRYVRVIPPDETEARVIRRRVPICNSSIGPLGRTAR